MTHYDMPIYTQGTNLPDWGLSWFDSNGGLHDFPSPQWTFVLEVTKIGSTSLEFTKDTGIIGYVAAPKFNVVIQWTNAIGSEIDGLAAPFTYVCKLFAYDNSLSPTKHMEFPGDLRFGVIPRNS